MKNASIFMGFFSFIIASQKIQILHWNTFFLYQKSYLLPNFYVVNLLNYLALIIVLKLFILNFYKSAVNQLVIYSLISF